MSFYEELVKVPRSDLISGVYCPLLSKEGVREEGVSS